MKTKIKPWKHISSRTLIKNPYEHFEEDIVLLPTGKRSKYFISNRHVRAVSIIVLDERKQILLQKEFRYPVGRVVYEFPGGLVKRGESFLKAAKRELQEETGIMAKKWRKLGTFYASVSRSGVVFGGFCAQQIQKGDPNPDPTEFIEHEWVSQSKLRSLLKNGTIVGQTTLAMLHLLKIR